jgi:uncharacterized protein (TIGR00375 family)
MFIADLHIHSKYSRATSKDMDIINLGRHAELKGIKVLGTGDFTHPMWFWELQNTLEETEKYGLYKKGKTYFILTTEVCNLFNKDGKGRRIHNIIFSPTFEVARKINKILSGFGDLSVDGRPILNLPVKDFTDLVLGVSEECLIIPAHIWTPWFSLFGANSGFDDIFDCFEEETKNIYGLETGLSSDPEMNWRLSALDKFTLVSNSDAHSPSKIGREANCFDVELNYSEIVGAIKSKDKKRFPYTIEFFPQEGKYHFDGHRKCGVCFSPKKTKEVKGVCPSCGGKITLGVMHRIEDLGDREEGFVPENAIPFKRLVPLEEIIAKALEKRVGSNSVLSLYHKLVFAGGGEYEVLLELSREELLGLAPKKVVDGIMNVREGKVKIKPGFDGVYGEIKIFEEEEESVQLSLL